MRSNHGPHVLKISYIFIVVDKDLHLFNLQDPSRDLKTLINGLIAQLVRASV